MDKHKVIINYFSKLSLLAGFLLGWALSGPMRIQADPPIENCVNINISGEVTTCDNCAFGENNEIPSDPYCAGLPLETTLSLDLNGPVPNPIGPHSFLNFTVSRKPSSSNQAPTGTVSIPGGIVPGVNVTATFSVSDPDGDPVRIWVSFPSAIEWADFSGLTNPTPSMQFRVKSDFNGQAGVAFILSDGNGGITKSVSLFNVGTSPGTPPSVPLGNFASPFGDDVVNFSVTHTGVESSIVNPPSNLVRGYVTHLSGDNYSFTKLTPNQSGSSTFLIWSKGSDGQFNGAFGLGTVGDPDAINDFNSDGSSFKTGPGYGDFNWTDFDFTGFPEGLHQFYITSTDAGGGISSSGFFSYMDNSPPWFNWINGLESGSRVGGILTPVDGEAEDSPATPGVREVKYAVVSLTPELETQKTGGDNPYPFLLTSGLDTNLFSDGNKIVRFVVRDYASNFGTEDFSLIFDNTPPTAVILINNVDASTLPDLKLVNGVTNIKVNAVDSNDGSISLINLFVGAGDPPDNATLKKTAADTGALSFDWDTTLDSDGTVQISALVTDEAGNTTLKRVQNVVIDNTPPVVEIIEPVASGTLTSELTQVVVHLSDLHPGNIEETVILKINGDVQPHTYSAPNIYLLNSPYNTDGAHVVSVSAADVLGNTGSDSNNFLVDLNNQPIAHSQSFSTAEDTGKTFMLTGSDPDGDAITFLITQATAFGTLTGDAPNLTYTPDSNTFGIDTLKFKVNDGLLDSAEATITITVTPVNDNPTANSQNISAVEDVVKNIVLTGADADNDSLTYAVVTLPTKGNLSGTAPNLTYTPHLNKNGPDSFQFKVNDGIADSALAVVGISIAPVNDAPSAGAKSISTPQETAVGVTLTGSDVEGDAMVFSIVSSPNQGVLTGTPPNLTYTPNANYNGVDSFTYKANDGTLDSPAAVVNITIVPINDSPSATPASVETDEDTSKAITISGTDADGDGLTYSIVTSPLRGLLTGTAPNLTYTPEANYNGADSFVFKVNDGTEDSNNATIAITINPVNDAPVADDNNVSTPEDVAVNFTLTGSDIDGDALSYIVTNAPVSGSLTGTAPNLTYTPNPGTSGSDSLEFVANDGTVNSVNGTISILVIAGGGNHPPVANTSSVAVDEDTAKNITLAATDADGDPLAYTIVSGPTRGSLSGTAPNVIYTPNLNYNGPDVFTFKANDGINDSNVASINVTVNPKNDAPVANNQNLNTPEDTAKNIVLTGSDVDGDALTFSVTSAPSKGVLTGSGANLVYTPNSNTNGADSFQFKVNDGTADSVSALVSINVTPVNDAPSALDGAAIIDEDNNLPLTLIVNDVDGDAIVYSIVTPPLNGHLSGSGANLTYTPNLNYFGSDSFTFKGRDGSVDSNTALFSISVNAVNDAPVADSKSISTNQNVSVNFNVTGSDIEGGVLSFAVPVNSINGTISGTAPNLTYIPNTGFSGVDSFNFTVNDGDLTSALAAVTVTVNSTNQSPTANAQSVSADEDVAKAIVLTGTDPENDPLTFTVVTVPVHGNLSGTIPNLIYTPAANYNGADTFTFKVNDGKDDSNTAVVSIAVSPVNDAPSANSQSGLRVFVGGTKAITLTGADVDGDSLTYEIVTGPTAGSLSGTPPNLVYNAALAGDFSFTFRIFDGNSYSNNGTVEIEVSESGSNQPPLADGRSIRMRMDSTLPILLTGSDPDGNAITFQIKSNPSNGALSGNPPSIVYTPNSGFNGIDTFNFATNDGLVDSVPATISIDVDGTPPIVSINSPVDGAVVSGIVPIIVSAPDPDMAQVDFYIDGQLVASDRTRPYQYNWDSFALANGAHTLMVRAIDNVGNINQAVSNITINNNLNPESIVINFTAPDVTHAHRSIVNIKFDVSGGDIDNVKLDVAGTIISGQGFVQRGNPEGTYEYNWNTILNQGPDGPKAIRAFATRISDGATIEQSISITVDNTSPVASISNPTNLNDLVLFGRQLFRFDAFDTYGLDRIDVYLGSLPIKSIPGSDNPLEFIFDTQARDGQTGEFLYPDGQYVMNAIIYDTAGNSKNISLSYIINNTNPPVSNIAVFPHPIEGAFVATYELAEIYYTFGGPIDLTSLADNSIRVTIKHNGKESVLPGKTQYEGSTAKLKFLGIVPPNTEVNVKLLNIRDTQGQFLASDNNFVRAMNKVVGGSVESSDGNLKLSIPTNCLMEDSLVLLETILGEEDSQNVAAANQKYGVTNADIKTLAGPYKSYTRNAAWEEGKDLNCAGLIIYEESGPPQQEEIGRLVDIQGLSQLVWRRLGTSGDNGSSASGPVSARKVQGQFAEFTTFRVTSFALPSSGIEGFINYPNPFDPNKEITSIQYSLAQDTDVTLSIHTLFGSLVKVINFSAGQNGARAAQNIISWDGRNGEGDMVANGGYILTLRAAGQKATRKISVVK